MPPFNSKPPASNRPSLKPMTQTLNYQRPVISQNQTPQNNNAPLTSDRKPIRTPIGPVDHEPANTSEKSLRLSTGNANTLIQPVLSRILSSYQDQNLTDTRSRMALTNDLNTQLPIGQWAVSASSSSIRMTVTSIDRRFTLIYLYQ